MGVSSSTPAHSPAAKSVAPVYLRVPVLVPVCELTMTLSPILRGPPTFEARLMVDPVGEGLVEEAFNLARLLEGDMEALALEAIVVLEATAGVSGTAEWGCFVNLEALEKIPCMGSH